MKRTNYYDIIPSSEHIYRIHSQENVYMELFVGSEQALLLDTGCGFGDLRNAVRSVTSLPLTVVNTHGHYDHANGNSQFKDVPIYMHQRDWEICRFYELEENRRKIMDAARHTKKGWNSDERVNILPEDMDENAYIQGPFTPLLPLTEDMVFDLGGITLKAIEVPGHTPGSCALLHLETGDLYIGDAANAHLVLSVFNAPVEEYKGTLQKLMNLDFVRMRLSHEPGWVPKERLDAYMDCITSPDPQNYIEATSPVRPGQVDYMYIRRGYTAADMDKPGFASFIVREKLIS